MRKAVIEAVDVHFDRLVGRKFYRLHRWAYEASDGRVGHRSAAGPMLLLTTTGRKSGEPRTTPLLYLPDGDGFAVVGSNGGRPQPPAWLLNVTAHPEVTVRAARRVVRCTARVLEGEEEAAMWPRLLAQHPGWGKYQGLTDRTIRVVSIQPVP